jgi:hypothetical protein
MYLSGKDPLSFTGPENYAFEMFADKRNITVRPLFDFVPCLPSLHPL